MKKEITALLSTITLSAKGRSTGFVIGNTTGTSGHAYLTPVRETGTLIYAGAIVPDVATAGEIARTVDGRVEYVFVDAEMKTEGALTGNSRGVEQAVRDNISASKVVSYKGNDLTADAADSLLARRMPAKGGTCAIIGLGNVGSKIALKLAERGITVRAFRRDQEKLKKVVAGLNRIVSDRAPSRIEACPTIEEACRGADGIVACADAKGIIGEKLVREMNGTQPPILVDVGKGCFADEVVNDTACTIYRLDVSIVQKHAFSGLIETDTHYRKSTGRRAIQDGRTISLVSLGLLGRSGEVVVDDIDAPSRIIGIADGTGSLIRDVGPYKDMLDKVRLKFGIS